MSPRFSRLDLPYLPPANAVISRDLSVEPLVGANGAHILCCKFRADVSFSPRNRDKGCFPPSATDARAMTIKHIRCVFSGRPPAQVKWIYAIGIVTRVERMVGRLRWTRATIKHKSNVCGQDWRSLNAASAHSSSTVAAKRAGPRPTRVSLAPLYLRPKAHFQGRVIAYKGSNSHSVSPHVRGQGRALRKQRFRPVSYGEFTLCSQGGVTS